VCVEGRKGGGVICLFICVCMCQNHHTNTNQPTNKQTNKQTNEPTNKQDPEEDAPILPGRDMFVLWAHGELDEEDGKEPAKHAPGDKGGACVCVYV
jgi:hypothetical protein